MPRPIHARPYPHPQARRKRALLPLLVAAALGITLFGGSAQAPPVAEAATIGRMVSLGGWSLGAFRTSSGVYTYCLEPGAANPVSAQQAAKLVSSFPGYSATTADSTGWNGKVSSGSLSGERVRRINYVLWKYGRTQSHGRAAAVQLAVWMLRGDPGAKAWLDYHVAWAKTHGGAGYVSRAQEYVAEAKAEAVAAVAPKPGSLKVTGAAGATSGMLHYPAGTTRIRVIGGTFSDGSDLRIVTGGKAGKLRWSVKWSSKSWKEAKTVSFRANWKRSVNEWPKQVRVYPPRVAKQQRLGAGVGPVARAFIGKLTTAREVERSFAPVLSTHVPKQILDRGDERFSDRVTLRVAPGTDAWPTRPGPEGITEYAPVVAHGTLYGPFAQPLTPLADAPADAPVAETVTLLAEHGPGEYAVESDGLAQDPGYYSWVWRIDEDAQDAQMRAGGMLPEDYAFRDDFGLAEEGQLVPTALRWRTELTSQEILPEDPVLRDRVFAQAKGGDWLLDDQGKRIPARLRLTVYRSDSKPQRQDAAPVDAEKVAETVVEVTGDEPVDEGVLTETLELHSSTTGWVTVQACLKQEDQPADWRGYHEEWCDDYGIPAETARSAAPVPQVSRPPEAPERPAAPESPRQPPTLAVTGGAALGGPLAYWGIGLFGAGSAALLVAGLVRQFSRGRRRRHSGVR